MKREREAAQELSAGIDRLLAGADPAKGGPPSPGAEEFAVASRLFEWSERLPPPPEALTRRVANIVQSPRAYRRPRTWRSAALGALAATVFLLLIWTIVPSGEQAWAQVWRVLLGQTEVELTPTLEPPTRAVREPLRDLVAAELAMGRAPSLPKVLPEGYALLEITAVSYPDLPSWISQPFFVELGYGTEDGSPELFLREYRLLFRDYGGIKGIKAATELVVSHEEVDVAGVPAALLTFSGDEVKQTLIWERDGLLLELESDCLSRDELLGVAGSVR
jgi:hypothetical protein